MSDELPITVPRELHDDMSETVYPEFAVSYLCGAVVREGVLYPRTAIAAERLKGKREAMAVLTKHKLHIGPSQRPEDRILIPAVEALKRKKQGWKSQDWEV